MFRYPMYGWFLVLIPVFLVWSLVYLRLKRKRLSQFIGHHQDVLVPHAPAWLSWVKGFFWGLGFFFLILAVMRPFYGAATKPKAQRGHDVFIVMDTSRSMLAADIKPSRLAFAQSEVRSLLEELKGDRVGLILFEGDAFVQCPLTLDYSAFSLFLDEVSVGLISRPGTNLSQALRLAVDNFSKKSTAREKIVVVFSDGETFEGDPVADAARAADAGVIVYTVALGSSAGEPIPIYQGNQLVGYKKDREQQVVLSKTNTELLAQIAKAGKGVCLDGNSYGVSESLAKLIAQRDTYKLGSTAALSYNEKYQPFLFLAFCSFMLAFFIPRRVKLQRYMVLLVLVVGLSKPCFAAYVSDVYRIQKGNKAYGHERYQDAEKFYTKTIKSAGLPEANQNLGLLYTKTQQFDQAEKAYLAAVSGLSGNKKAEAFYNLGTMYLEQEQWEKAVEAYRSSLRINPKDLDTKKNLEIALRMLKQDKKKQKNQKNQKNQKSQQQQKPQQSSGDKDKKDQQHQGQQQGQQHDQNNEKKKAAEAQLRFLDQKEKEARKRYKQRVVRESAVEKDW